MTVEIFLECKKWAKTRICEKMRNGIKKERVKGEATKEKKEEKEQNGENSETNVSLKKK